MNLIEHDHSTVDDPTKVVSGRCCLRVGHDDTVHVGCQSVLGPPLRIEVKTKCGRRLSPLLFEVSSRNSDDEGTGSAAQLGAHRSQCEGSLSRPRTRNREEVGLGSVGERNERVALPAPECHGCRHRSDQTTWS
jgi:hypothetical protein